MRLENKNILLISPEPWDHIFVSKHHYATHLAARGNKVFFLNPPSKEEKVMQTDFENVWSVYYTGFPKGMRFYPSFLEKFAIKLRYDRIQNLCNTQFDIVWSFDNSVFYNFEALPKSVLSISHIVDLNQDFQFKKASKTSTINLSNTRSVLRKQLNISKNSHFINHGLATPQIERSLPKLNTTNGRFSIGYAGNLDIVYLDWNLINELVEKHQDTCDFFFAGSLHDSDRISWFKTNTNVHFLGTLQSCTLQSFYAQMDILFICYKADQYSDQLENTHKMMEYLRSGKMVIATKTMEYIHLADNSLIAMANKNSEFPMIFQEVLDKLYEWNSDNKMSRRISFAMGNSYDKQIERIEKILLQTVIKL